MAKRILNLHRPKTLSHRCVACGASCRHILPGPISQSELDRIDIDKIRAARPDLPDSLWFVKDDEFYFETRDQVCIFLEVDGLCGIHRHLGVESKPLVCRSFPIAVTHTPDGLWFSNTFECRELKASRAGGLLDDTELDTLGQLYGDSAQYNVGDRVLIVDELVIDYDQYREHEDRLIDLLSYEADLATTLRASCDAVAERFDLPYFNTTPALFADRFVAFLTDLAATLDRLAKRSRSNLERGRVSRLAAVARAMASDLDVTAFALDHDAALLARDFAINFLQGKTLLENLGLVKSLAMLNFRYVFALGVASLQVAEMYRQRITVRDFNDAIVLVQFLTRGEDMLGFFIAALDDMQFLFFESWRNNQLSWPAELRSSLVLSDE